MTKTFLILTVICLAIGIIVDNEIIASFGKALAGTFFILVFLFKLNDYWDHEKPNTVAGKSHTHGHGHSH